MKVTGSRSTTLLKKRGLQGRIARRRQNTKNVVKGLQAAGKALAALHTAEENEKSPSKPISKSPKILGLKVNVSDLHKQLEEQCVQVTKPSLPKQFPKKDKRKVRRDVFLKKIKAIHALEQEVKNKKKKKRRKTSKSTELEMAVPDLVPETSVKPAKPAGNKDSQAKKKNKLLERVSKKPTPKANDRLKQDLKDIQLFKEVLANSVYQANPGTAITKVVRRKVCESYESD